MPANKVHIVNRSSEKARVSFPARERGKKFDAQVASNPQCGETLSKVTIANGDTFPVRANTPITITVGEDDKPICENMVVAGNMSIVITPDHTVLVIKRQKAPFKLMMSEPEKANHDKDKIARNKIDQVQNIYEETYDDIDQKEQPKLNDRNNPSEYMSMGGNLKSAPLGKGSCYLKQDTATYDNSGQLTETPEPVRMRTEDAVSQSPNHPKGTIKVLRFSRGSRSEEEETRKSSTDRSMEGFEFYLSKGEGGRATGKHPTNVPEHTFTLRDMNTYMRATPELKTKCVKGYEIPIYCSLDDFLLRDDDKDDDIETYEEQ